MDPYKIVVCFVERTNKNILSEIIELAEHSEFSHTLNIFEDLDSRRKIFHMISPTACIDEEMKYMHDHHVVHAYEIPMTFSKDFICGYIHGRNGSGEYSIAQYINHPGRILFGIDKPLIKNGDRNRVCSEESFDLLRWSALTHDPDLKLDPDMVSPKMLKEALDKTDARKLSTEEITILLAK